MSWNPDLALRRAVTRLHWAQEAIEEAETADADSITSALEGAEYEINQALVLIDQAAPTLIDRAMAENERAHA